MTIDKLSHTTWKYKCRIVFALKYRRQVVNQEKHGENPASIV